MLCGLESAAVRDIVLSFVAIGGLVVSVVGLFTWRRQQKYINRHELAGRYFSATIRLRNSLFERLGAFENMYIGREERPGEGMERRSRKLVMEQFEKQMKAVLEFDSVMCEVELFWDPRVREVSGCLMKSGIDLNADHRKRMAEKIETGKGVPWSDEEREAFEARVNQGVSDVAVFIRKNLVK